MPKIHILGASGSGTTTLGRTVADLLAVPHFDTDSFYWLPTDPPFTTPRPLTERLPLLMQHLPPTGGWVLSGSALKWAKPLEPLYELIVYLRLDPSIRMDRLRQRERTRYGRRIEPTGDMATANAEFLAWAAAYDTVGPEQRSRLAHEQWLAEQAAPVIRLDASKSVQALAGEVLSAARKADWKIAGEKVCFPAKHARCISQADGVKTQNLFVDSPSHSVRVR
jgi:adenylate kinase family enzyme